MGTKAAVRLRTRVLEWSFATAEQTGEYQFIVSSSTGESVISKIAAVSVDPTFTKITEGPVVTDQEGSVNFSRGDGTGLFG